MGAAELAADSGAGAGCASQASCYAGMLEAWGRAERIRKDRANGRRRGSEGRTSAEDRRVFRRLDSERAAVPIRPPASGAAGVQGSR